MSGGAIRLSTSAICIWVHSPDTSAMVRQVLKEVAARAALAVESQILIPGNDHRAFDR